MRKICIFLLSMLFAFVLYAGTSGKVISESKNKKENILVREHLQTVEIGENIEDFQREIHSGINENDIIGNLKKNDLIEVSEIWYITSKGGKNTDIWLKINFENTIGFIHYVDGNTAKKNTLSIDPYRDGTWELLESFDDGWTARKVNQTLAVYGEEDEIELRDRPGTKNSKVIALIPRSQRKGHDQINLEVGAVTEETEKKKGGDRWVRVSWEGKTGWVYAGPLQVERGGPKIWTPENILEWNLGW